VGLVFIYAIGAAALSNTGNYWYRSLQQPSWQPPDYVFGLIWPYNFIVLAFAAVYVVNRLTTTNVVIYLSIFAASIIAALSWAYQFYRPHNLSAATVAITFVATLTVPMLYFIYQASKALFLAACVYQIWVIIASLLSYNYARLN
jgi:tryptophan-rich sensory protein